MRPARALPVPGILFAMALAAAAPGAEAPPGDPEALEKDVTQGALRIVKKDGVLVECPLKHTDVRAEISGFIARVKVTQTFSNPLDEKIEAVYVFPLPHESAVDDMTMVTGDRRIVGLIKRRAEARRIYEQALLSGRTAALLEQERPNIFTQSVGNIPPRQEVRIEIGYVDVLRYDQGNYEFHFPMVVGPRYIPGAPVSPKPPVPPELAGKVGGRGAEGGDRPTEGTGWAADTKDVPDASRITPQVLKPGFRTGHDISLEVALDAGVPIRDIRSLNHLSEIREGGGSRAAARLSPDDSIPNKDFVLRYSVLGKKPEMALLCHTDGSTGYFMLMIQPREDEKLAKSPPREMVFMVDVSGSMSGQPIAKCREAMKGFLELVREKDTIQVITFQSRAQKLFEGPVPATKENIQKALNFSQGLQGGGGTEMLKGVRMAIEEPIDKERMRVVIMMTDGYIGNEPQIIEAVGKGCGDQIRFWCLGIGTSVNRFLVDGVARQGGGMGRVVSLTEDPAPAVKEFMERIQRAQLAKIKVDWGELRAADVYPARIPELWAGRPVVLFGLYPLSSGGKTHRISVSGIVEGEPVTWPLEVAVPAKAEESLALSRVWAREKIEELMQETYYAGSPEVEEEVTAIALEYRLMSPYTSFVAVDESEIPSLTGQARPPRRMPVPVPMPEGVSYAGVFGGEAGEFEDSGALPPGAPLGEGASGGFGGSLNKRQAGAAPTPAGVALSRAKGKVAAAQTMRSDAVPQQDRAMFGFDRSLGATPVGARPSARGGAAAGGARNAAPSRETLRRAAAESLPFSPPSASGEVKMQIPEVLKAAEALRKGSALESRARFAQAYLLDQALVNAGLSDGSSSARALESLEKVSGELLSAWKKDLPGLGKKLDLVIRDSSIEEALAEVGKAAGIRLRSLEGSLDDSRALLGRKEVRVTYLDLRNAIAAEALDWILRPARLAWQAVPADPAPVVVWGADRRNPAFESAWVYDVGRLSIPLKEELEKGGGPQMRAEVLRASQEEFLAAARRALGIGPEGALWFAPGRLLIFGSAKVHASAERLFRDLADPKASLGEGLKALQRASSARAEKRKESAASLALAREEEEALSKIEGYGWPLLAQSAAGKLDDEAITELEIAWKSPALAEPAKGALRNLAPRAAWTVREAALRLPGEPRLSALSRDLLRRSRPAAEAALADLSKSPEDENAWSRAFYSVLAYREDGEFFASARKALLLPGAGGRDMEGARALLGSLLDPAADPAAVAAAFRARNSGRSGEALMGEDRVVLAALACRRAGGEAWEAFRSEARDVLGGQPLPGSVVILVNGLGRNDLAATR